MLGPILKRTSGIGYRIWDMDIGYGISDMGYGFLCVSSLGVAFAWDLHDRQARPSSVRVGPCTAVSSAWRSCCPLVLPCYNGLGVFPGLWCSRGFLNVAILAQGVW